MSEWIKPYERMPEMKVPHYDGSRGSNKLSDGTWDNFKTFTTSSKDCKVLVKNLENNEIFESIATFNMEVDIHEDGTVDGCSHFYVYWYELSGEICGSFGSETSEYPLYVVIGWREMDD